MTKNAPKLKLTDTPGPISRKVAARWTKSLTKSWTPVSDYFLHNYYRLPMPLTNSEAMFVVHLMSCKWDADMPYPSFARLATRMGKSQTAVRNDARNLQIKGCLIRHVRVGTTNRFDLKPLFKKLETMMAADEKKKDAKQSGRSHPASA